MCVLTLNLASLMAEKSTMLILTAGAESIFFLETTLITIYHTELIICAQSMKQNSSCKHIFKSQQWKILTFMKGCILMAAPARLPT